MKVRQYLLDPGAAFDCMFDRLGTRDRVRVARLAGLRIGIGTPVLGEIIRHQREQAALTQPELATRAGVPLATLRNSEQGRTQPTWRTMVRIARALRISLDTFAGLEDETTASG